MTTRPVAFITGAARGIGAASAIAFAANGYDVALLDRESAELDTVAGRVREHGGETLVHVVDLYDLELAKSAVDRTVSYWNRLDVLVNNAAWRTLQTLRTMDTATWERTLRICLTAPAFLAKWAAHAMEKRGEGGVILNVSSMMSQQAAGTSPAYVASKGALDALTFELAALYGRAGIRVVAVNPGWIDTGMSGDYRAPDAESLSEKVYAAAQDAVPLGRPGSPEEIAEALVWLAGPGASYITGTRLLVDGGWSHHHLGYGLKKIQFPEEFP